MKLFTLFPLLTVLAVSGSTYAAEHKLSGENTSIKFLGTKTDGKHSGSFEKLEGTLKLDDADITKSSLTVKIDVDSLTSDDKKLTSHLKSPDFFNAKQYPDAKFESKSIAAGKDKDSYKVTGDLTMLGKTASVTFEAKATTADGTTTFAAETEIKRSEWGMTYGKGKVNDEVTLTLSTKVKK